jgi:lipopolysaccharide/colanic/teichoic acid biosynthesis glycosyltransferase
MTGPWQVMGRSDIPVEDMLRLDYTYVIGWSFTEDLKLLMRTATAVIGGKGVS